MVILGVPMHTRLGMHMYPQESQQELFITGKERTKTVDFAYIMQQDLAIMLQN